MAEYVNQFIELINVGIAVAALFAGIWAVLLLAAIAVRGIVRLLGIERDDDVEPSSLTIRRSRTARHDAVPAVSEVAS